MSPPWSSSPYSQYFFHLSKEICLKSVKSKVLIISPGDPDGVAGRQPDPRLVSAGRVAAHAAALGQGEPVAAVAADNLQQNTTF